MLLGMLAAAIPILLHLIHRQRARRRRFAAVDFLLLSDQRLARRLRLRQILVLLLRTLLMLAIPFALAKPYLPEEPVAAAPELEEPGAVALVVDDSASMQAEAPDGEGTLLDRAVATARETLSEGGPQTSFAVVTAGEPSRVLTDGTSFDRRAVRRALDRIEAKPRGADMAGALREAERVLAKSEQKRRRVVIIGDQARHAWDGITRPWALADPPDTTLVDVREGQPVPNRAVTGVEVEPVGGAAGGSAARARIRVEAANHADEPLDASATIELGEREASVELEAEPRSNTEGRVEMPLPQGSGYVAGEASLPADALGADDRWPFTVDLGGRVDVLVVNGAPRSVPHLDEVFFLRAALRAASEEGAGLRTSYGDPGAITAKRLEGVETVVLANVGRLTPSQQEALKRHVEDGGGLLVTAGDQLNADSNASYGELLPAPIRSIKRVVRPGSPAAKAAGARLEAEQADHPVLRPFDSLEEASLFQARVWQHLLVERRLERGYEVVASYDNGAPALLESELGRGRVMLLTTTIDRGWSDLVIRSSFVPLVERMLRHLADRMGQRDTSSHSVGEVAEVPLTPGEGELVLELPDGGSRTLRAPGEGAAGRVQVAELDQPGIHRLHRRDAPDDAVLFAAHVDRAESDLQPAETKRLQEVLERPGRDRAPMASRGSEGEAGAAAGGVPEGTRVWPWVLLALFGLLISEAWLVVRG